MQQHTTQHKPTMVFANDIGLVNPDDDDNGDNQVPWEIGSLFP